MSSLLSLALRSAVPATLAIATVAASGSVAAREAAPAGAQRPAARPPNVLLIMADDLAPRFGAYGGPARTPHLDRLASQGITFNRAYSQFPWCAPSRASMLTGTRPSTTRVFNLSTPFRKALPDIQTLPEYFKANGYFSARIGKIFHQGVPGDIGTSGPDDPQSWNQVINPAGRDVSAEKAGMLVNHSPGIPYGSAMAYLADEGADEEQTDGLIATATIQMLEAHKDKPFFIAAGFYRPHVPEVAPKSYFDLYPLSAVAIADETPARLASIPAYTKAWTPDHFGMSPDEQRRMIQSYHAATSYMDAQVGRILAALDELGLADNTIVVFTSDHGFLLGEHGQWMKNILWDGSSRVPLILRSPAMANPGAKSGKPVELVDLYPTLTELAGLPRYARNEGSSLVPLLKNPKDPRWTEAAYSQIAGGRSVHTERYRYTEWEGGRLGVELYDHQTDPGEHDNLAGKPRHAALAARLKAMLPEETVEKRPPPITYDPVRDCLVIPKTVMGAEGAGGLARCAATDP